MNYRLIKPLMVVFAVACVASAASAQPAVSPVQGKLVIPDAKVLPGVPFDMWVELRNASDGSVGVGLCPRLLVRTAKGTAFEVGHAHGGPYLVMAPGETKTLPYPIGSELGAYFFSDSRLSPPGQYTISMRMDYCFGHGVPQQDLLPPTFLGPVVTNEVTVERLQPAGSDAAVWQEILDTSKGNWPPSIFPAFDITLWQRVWSDVLTKYPDSNYVPYALLAISAGQTGLDYRKKILDAIDRFPGSPVIELLHYEAWQFDPYSDVGNKEWATLQQSKRPTTRKRVFPQEFEPKKPCPPEHDCEP